MVTEPEFARLQRAFADYLRDPQAHDAPVPAEDRRLAIYRHAIYKNVEGLLADNYPRIRAILDDDRWELVVREYLVSHQSHASVFVEVPLEFINWLDSAPRIVQSLPPFFRELAHFDWLETLVGADTRRIDRSRFAPDGDLLAGIPYANPILRRIDYHFPVHAIDSDYQPSKAPTEPTRIAAFRDLDNRYGFLDLNAASARLLDYVIDNTERNGRELLQVLADELGVPADAGFEQHGREILERMRTRQAILGTAS